MLPNDASKSTNRNYSVLSPTEALGFFQFFIFHPFFSSRSPIHAREGGRELNFYASECKHADVSPFIGDRS